MMQYKKSRLINISEKIVKNKKITPDEIDLLLNFSQIERDSSFISFLKRYSVPLSLIAGAFIAIFANETETFTSDLPEWTNLSPRLLAGLDYLWSIIGDPVEKANILYHLPNIFLYTFGIVGIKSFVDTIKHKTWLENVLNAKEILLQNINNGNLNLKMKDGFSMLFVGKSDFIGKQFVLNNKPNQAVTISSQKQEYTNIWNSYDVSAQYDDLKNIVERSDSENIGEYIFFPVKDDQIFLPNESAYDLSPHKLDIICQNIRTIEKELKLEPKRIVIIGDKYHKSVVRSEDNENIIENSEDIISLESISKKYNDIVLLDPSDIVIKKIIEIANGRRILFRATKNGIDEYKNRFYERLRDLDYKQNPTEKGILTIGHDIFEDQTEQQTLARKIDDYYPVVLSKSVKDALKRNGYKNEEFLYVPNIVLKRLSEIAAER